MRREERMARMQYLPSLSQSLSSSKRLLRFTQFLYNLSGLQQLKPFLQPSPHGSPVSAHLATQFMTHASEINGATFFFNPLATIKTKKFFHASSLHVHDQHFLCLPW
jgi:hypothetical protein